MELAAKTVLNSAELQAIAQQLLIEGMKTSGMLLAVGIVIGGLAGIVMGYALRGRNGKHKQNTLGDEV